MVAILALLALVLLTASALLAPSAGAKTKAKPKRADLAVGSATSRLTDGRLTLALVARNLGRGGARASTGAVYWRPLVGNRKAALLKRFPVLAVANRGRRKLTVNATLPAGTAAGSFAISVCLDVRTRVRESNRRNNCRSAGTVTVPAAEVSPVTVVSPTPVAGTPAIPGNVPTPTPPPGGGSATPPPGGGTTPPPGGGTTPPPTSGDTTPPDTLITRGPVGLTSERTASLWAASTESGSTFTCRLDAAEWASCPPINNLANVADGTHTYEVRAADAAGNVDPTPASRTWTVDGTPPQTTITGPPAGPVNTTAGLPAFTSSEDPASFECRLGNAGAWTPCSSPHPVTLAGEGNHTFNVRAYDAAGNVDTTPASRTWTVDLTAPNTTLTGGPSGTVSSNSASFTASSEAGASFECRLDGGTWVACTSPHDLTGLGNGQHTFEVRAVDPAGNRDQSPESRTWTVDTTAPDTSILTGPAGTVASASAGVTFTSPEAGATFECRLDSGSWAACTSPRQLAGLADGSRTFEVRALDALGNADPSPASRTWTVDTTAPDTSITTGPSGAVSSTSATFEFTSADSSASFQCQLDGGAWTACTSPRQLTTLADGSRTFAVRAVDPVGNTDGSPASRTWTVDTTAPNTTLNASGPTGTVNSATATFTFSTPEGGATLQCRIDAGAWTACTSPRQLTGLTDGSHTFEVRALDALGNADPTPASRTWTVDTAAPDTSIASGPQGTVASSSATFAFSSPATDTIAFECRIDGGAWVTCTSPRQLAGLPDGQHTFDVRAIDAAGNIESTPATRTWTVDTTAPETSITSGPTGPVSNTSPAFAFSSPDAGATFQCRLDGGAWAPCTSPRQFVGLADGSHTFAVRAVDAIGNIDASEASRTWTIDTVAPNTSITGGPSAPVSSTSASFTFTASEAGSTFECRLDAGAWAACTSPRDFSGLTNGSHTFEVRATDTAGNLDATPAARTWTVDTVAPDTSLTSGPSGAVSSTSATFVFSSPDATATFECRVDAGAWGACTSPHQLTGLSQGAHTFEVRARDAAANTDATPVSRTWTVDTAVPDTSLDSGPSGAVSSTGATFAFSSPDSSVTFQCKLDAGAWAACTSPHQLTSLSQGSHTFEVRAVDGANNTDASPASRTWTVDTTVPDTSITAGPSGAVSSTSATFTFTSPEAGATFECRIDAGAWGACTSPHQLTGLSQGSRTFDVRARDAAGNIDGSPASRTWTVDTTAPDTSLTSGPSGAVSSTSATFAFSSEAGASFECRLDGGAFSTCNSPHQLSGLAQGSHTFEVRARDAAGNIDATPASRTWTVDTSVPDTSLTGGPSGTVTSTSASFTLTSTEGGATFQCRLDGGAFSACTSPHQLTGLADGSHTLEVRAVDAAGNTDASPASRTWTVDATAPDTSITGGPTGTVTSTSASFTFTSPEGGATFECRLDGGVFSACSSPHQLTGLADRQHTFDVRARDAQGNADATPASRTWTVDTTAPDTTITSGPADPSTSPDATFEFSSPEQGAAFECRVDGGAFGACSSPHQLTGLADGQHTVDVRARDAVGNADSTPATRTWTIAVPPPP